MMRPVIEARSVTKRLDSVAREVASRVLSVVRRSGTAQGFKRSGRFEIYVPFSDSDQDRLRIQGIQLVLQYTEGIADRLKAAGHANPWAHRGTLVTAKQGRRYIRIIYQFGVSELAPTMFEALSHDIAETVRHELEHDRQQERGAVFAPGSAMPRQKGSEQTDWSDPEKVRAYLLNPHEVDAVVAGAKLYAKRTKTSVEEFFRKRSHALDAAMKRQGVSDGARAAVLKDVMTAWILRSGLVLPKGDRTDAPNR